MVGELIRSETVPFFWWFLVPKIVFWKNHYWVGTTTDCFEPIFGFLMTFCFEKHRSDSWSRIGMFSELSGRSDGIMQKLCFKIINFSFLIQVIRALEDKLTSAIEVEVQRREKDMKKMKLRYEVMARMELNAKLSEVNAFLERRAEVNFWEI